MSKLSRGFKLNILHFNDVYNIDQITDQDPVGGASRFVQSIKNQLAKFPNTVILFSGDCLSPSTISRQSKGLQMVDVFNEIGVHCAVYGNHEFDFGVDHLDCVSRMFNFPWLLSNVKDDKNECLANGKNYHIINRRNCRIGIIGLVEYEWICTISTLEKEKIIYNDYVNVTNKICRKLKMGYKCDLIICLTHMHWNNDSILAESCPGVDLILGGHDHDYKRIIINGKTILKSGSDFRNYSFLTLEKSKGQNLKVEVERFNICKSLPQCLKTVKIVEKYQHSFGECINTVIGKLSNDMDARNVIVRCQESTAGNVICDILLKHFKADIVLLNSGALRSDTIHRKGNFTIRDLYSLLPIPDDRNFLIQISGKGIKESLENSVCKWPQKSGRFLQVSGLSFSFDPTRSINDRVTNIYVYSQKQKLKMNKFYTVVVREYIYSENDGYKLGNCKVLNKNNAPILSDIVKKFFQQANFVNVDIVNMKRITILNI